MHREGGASGLNDRGIGTYLSSATDITQIVRSIDDWPHLQMNANALLTSWKNESRTECDKPHGGGVGRFSPASTTSSETHHCVRQS